MDEKRSCKAHLCTPQSLKQMCFDWSRVHTICHSFWPGLPFATCRRSSSRGSLRTDCMNCSDSHWSSDRSHCEQGRKNKQLEITHTDKYTVVLVIMSTTTEKVSAFNICKRKNLTGFILSDLASFGQSYLLGGGLGLGTLFSTVGISFLSSKFFHWS